MTKATFLNAFRKISGIVALLLLTSWLATAQNKDAGITLSMENASIGQVIKAIEQQSRFLFINKGVDIQKKVSVNVSNVPVQKALEQIFKGTDVTWSLDGTYIILSMKSAKAEEGPATVSGFVTDGQGQPIAGAAVIIAGTSTGVVTDFDGSYSIQVPSPAKDKSLEFNILGYETKTVKIGDKTSISVTLNEAATVLDDVVVTALGIKREEKALSYNVQKVDGDIVNIVKDANFVNSLSGKIAGLQINQSASGAGGSTRVIMRGVKSISGNNNALYVIDGIPMPNLRSAQTEGYYETPDGGDFEGIANLNPEDFESMSILTGATAAALYGSQGANGVILITTKKGQEGKLRVNYSNNTTFSSPFVMPLFQNTYGTDATAPSMSWGTKLETPTSYDPADFFQTGYNTQNSLSVSAGNEMNQTYFSASSLNSRGLINNNTFNRYNFSIRNTAQLVKDKLVLDVSGSYMRQYKRNPTIQGLYHNPLVATYLFPRGDGFTKDMTPMPAI